MRAGLKIRRFAVLAGTTLMFLSLAVAPSRSSCAPPTVAFKDGSRQAVREVSPGDSVTLIGEFWTSDCFDTGPIGACERGPGDERPMEGIDVDLMRNERVVSRVVKDVTASSDLSLTVVFSVPELEPGRYLVLVHDRGAQGYPELWLKVRA